MKDSPKTHNDSCSLGCTGLMWWMTLLMAVLAVPSFAVVIAFAAPLHGVGQILVFILACWLCTFLGMKLMSHPKMKEKIFKR